MDDFARGVSVLLKLFFYLMFFGGILFAIGLVIMFIVECLPRLLAAALMIIVPIVAVYWIVKLIGIIARKLS